MADKDQYNDEYQFTDLDAVDPNDGHDTQDPDTTTSASEEIPLSGVEQSTVKRNGIIVVVVLVFIILMYKLVGSLFSETKQPAAIKPPVTALQAPVIKPQIQPKPAIQVQPVQVTSLPETNRATTDAKVQEKLAALDIGQQSMRSELDSMKTQLSTIETNITALVSKMTELNTTITNLGSKVDEISHEFELMAMRREAAKHSRPHVTRSHGMSESLRYYIQAVIPGRAWLIATNGSTLTVRDGTLIPGYGVVKLIDPSQGRVITSSGQVIKFSQTDS